MAWTTPTIRTTGELITASIWNTDLVDNLTFLQPASTWTTPAFSAGNFTANGAMTWTVGSGDVTTYSYIRIGKTITVAFLLSATSVGGTPNTALRIAIPGGLTAARTVATTFIYNDNAAGNAIGFAQVTSGNAYIELFKLTVGNWSAATDATSCLGEITFEVT